MIDSLCAHVAAPVRSFRKTFQGNIDFPQFPQVPVDLRKVHVDHEVCEGIILGITRLFGNRHILFLVRAQQRLPDLLSQHRGALL